MSEQWEIREYDRIRAAAEAALAKHLRQQAVKMPEKVKIYYFNQTEKEWRVSPCYKSLNERIRDCDKGNQRVACALNDNPNTPNTHVWKHDGTHGLTQQDGSIKWDSTAAPAAEECDEAVQGQSVASGVLLRESAGAGTGNQDGQPQGVAEAAKVHHSERGPGIGQSTLEALQAQVAADCKRGSVAKAEVVTLAEMRYSGYRS